MPADRPTVLARAETALEHDPQTRIMLQPYSYEQFHRLAHRGAIQRKPILL